MLNNYEVHVIISSYESIKFDRTGNHQGEAIGFGKAGPGSEGRHKDRRSIAGIGGPAAGTGDQSTRAKSHGFGALYSCREPRGDSGFGAEASHGATNSTDAGCAEATGTEPTEEPARIRTIAANLGRADAEDPLEGALGSKGDNSSGPEVDA